jgi:hypothetical protein
VAKNGKKKYLLIVKKKFCHKKEEDTMRIWSLACGEV